jgi:hypothetical protein
MKTTARMMMAVAALLGTAPLASAAATASKDGSQLAIWIFLGLCALIIVVQLFPVVFMAYGLLKGLAKGEKQETEVPAEVVNHK